MWVQPNLEHRLSLFSSLVVENDKGGEKERESLDLITCGLVKFDPGGWDTPYNGLYGEAPPERGTFFRLQLYKRVGISQVEVLGKSVI